MENRAFQDISYEAIWYKYFHLIEKISCDISKFLPPNRRLGALCMKAKPRVICWQIRLQKFVPRTITLVTPLFARKSKQPLMILLIFIQKTFPTLTTFYEVRKSNDKLQTKRAPWYDEIGNVVLRNLSDKALSHLVQIVNHMFTLGHFPNSKLAMTDLLVYFLALTNSQKQLIVIDSIERFVTWEFCPMSNLALELITPYFMPENYNIIFCLLKNMLIHGKSGLTLKRPRPWQHQENVSWISHPIWTKPKFLFRSLRLLCIWASS